MWSTCPAALASALLRGSLLADLGQVVAARLQPPAATMEARQARSSLMLWELSASSSQVYMEPDIQSGSGSKLKLNYNNHIICSNPGDNLNLKMFEKYFNILLSEFYLFDCC